MRRISHLLAFAFVAVLAACAQQPAPTVEPEASGSPPKLAPATVSSPASLFFSEYIEGSSNNKALEIFNGTGAPVDLAANDYVVQVHFNGSASPGLTIALSGTIADGDVYVLAQSSAAAEILAVADQTNGASWFNGDDAVVLRSGTTILDVIGQLAFDPGSEWGSDLTSTANATLRRLARVCIGDPFGDDPFDPADEWAGYASNTFDGLGAHEVACVDEPPRVTATTPSDGAIDVAVGADLTVGFSEPVTVAPDGFELTCDGVGTIAVTAEGTNRSIAIDPDSDLPFGTACTLTVFAAGVVDQDDAPDSLAANVVVGFTTSVDACVATSTPIYTVQGNGAATPLEDQTVLVRGVVVGDYEGPSPTLRGFYLQDPLGDGDAATSDAVFVFNGSANSVDLGDDVAVSGTAEEFQGQTQVEAVAVTVCGTGATVEPVDVTLPVPDASYLERYEGMLVRFPQTLYVTETFQLGRFGLVAMSVGDRLAQPTAIALPGAPAAAVQEANDLARILVDDDLNVQNPERIEFGRRGLPLDVANPLRGGDTATGMVGVLTFTWAGNSASGNAYRLRPIGALGGGVPDFQPTNPRPLTPPSVGGDLRVAALNVLNYFATIDRGPDICGPAANQDCRGADSAFELERQRAKILATLEGLDADVIGLIELENDGGASLQDLVDGLNGLVGAGTYAGVATGPVGSDAITVGLLYRTAAVAPLGSFAVLDDTFDPAFRDGFNRPALAQTFVGTSSTSVFTVVVNHLKSKGSNCDAIGDLDQGDGQGNCNGTRTQAVEVLLDWLATDPTGAGDPDVLVIGDLNAYAKEDPVRALEDAGYVNLQPTQGDLPAITYVFDGQWGALDYALASPSLTSQVAGADAWHTNAAEPSVLSYETSFKPAAQVADLYAPDAFRASDHDPLLVGVDLAGPNCSAAAPSRATLWPPRHQFVSVSIGGVTGDDPVSIAVTSVFQDEPVDAYSDTDGSTSPDAAIGVGDAVDLRAERDETGNGRVYHVAFRATDANGQTCAGTVTVAVPRSQGKNGAAVDDGPLFDATLD